MTMAATVFAGGADVGASRSTGSEGTHSFTGGRMVGGSGGSGSNGFIEIREKERGGLMEGGPGSGVKG